MIKKKWTSYIFFKVERLWGTNVVIVIWFLFFKLAFHNNQVQLLSIQYITQQNKSDSLPICAVFIIFLLSFDSI